MLMVLMVMMMVMTSESQFVEDLSEDELPGGIEHEGHAVFVGGAGDVREDFPLFSWNRNEFFLDKFGCLVEVAAT